MLIKKIRIFAGFDGFLNCYILFLLPFNCRICHIYLATNPLLFLFFFLGKKINSIIFHTFFFKKMIQLSSKFYSISAMSIFSESPFSLGLFFCLWQTVLRSQPKGTESLLSLVQAEDDPIFKCIFFSICQPYCLSFFSDSPWAKVPMLFCLLK